jgi:hypothetical protein
MRHVRVPAFTTASALDLISPQSVAHICRRKLQHSTNNNQLPFRVPSFLIRTSSFPRPYIKHQTSDIKSANGRIRRGEPLTLNLKHLAALR